MKRMGIPRQLAMWAIGTSVVLLTTAPALACICAVPKSTVRESVWQSALVLSGEVIAIESRDDSAACRAAWAQVDRHAVDVACDVAVTFQVDAVWKGPKGATAVIVTDDEERSCGFTFELGERYLVYAWKVRKGPYRTGLCGRNRALDTASYDLLELGPPMVKPAPRHRPGT